MAFSVIQVRRRTASLWSFTPVDLLIHEGSCVFGTLNSTRSHARCGSLDRLVPPAGGVEFVARLATLEDAAAFPRRPATPARRPARRGRDPPRPRGHPHRRRPREYRRLPKLHSPPGSHPQPLPAHASGSTDRAEQRHPPGSSTALSLRQPSPTPRGSSPSAFLALGQSEADGLTASRPRLRRADPLPGEAACARLAWKATTARV